MTACSGPSQVTVNFGSVTVRIRTLFASSAWHIVETGDFDLAGLFACLGGGQDRGLEMDTLSRAEVTESELVCVRCHLLPLPSGEGLD